VAALEGGRLSAMTNPVEACQPLLDALPSSAAVVGPDGALVAVNRRWAAFAAANGARMDTVLPPASYLAVCERAEPHRDDGGAARRVREGLAAVLTGQVEEIALTYPCHAPDEQRWFHVAVTPLVLQGVRHALVVHDDITEQEQRFRLLTDLSSTALLELSPDGAAVFANRAWVDLQGGEAAAALGSGWLQAVEASDRPVVTAAVRGALADPAPLALETRLTVSGRPRWVRLEGRPQTAHDGGLLRYVLSAVDVHDEHIRRERLEHQALRDPLTRLPNRERFLRETAEVPLRTGDVVMFLDLDGFKQVNDAGGHATGDAVLGVVAARLRGAVRPGDVAARFGGDEFVALLRGVSREEADAVAVRLLRSFAPGVSVRGRSWAVGASLGLAAYREGESVEEVLHRADLALLQAKAAGKRRVRWHGDQAALPGPREGHDQRSGT
jgi:diguanylate cyclase (GGDEF)-like protein/PAS domain S-box-containing protein